jgi:hypothetical protein
MTLLEMAHGQNGLTETTEKMVGDGFYLKGNEQWKVKPIVLVFTGIFISVT